MVGCAEGSGQCLVMVEEDPVVPHVGQVGGDEKELRRTPVLAPRHGVGEVGIRGEAAVFIGGGEFQPIDVALGVVDRGEYERLAEKAVIKLVPRALVIAVQAHLDGYYKRARNQLD